LLLCSATRISVNSSLSLVALTCWKTFPCIEWWTKRKPFITGF